MIITSGHGGYGEVKLIITKIIIQYKIMIVNNNINKYNDDDNYYYDDNSNGNNSTNTPYDTL